MKEIIPMIPDSSERQIYKYLHLFVSNKCIREANIILNEHIIKPLLAKDMELLKSVNQYSMFMQAYGYRVFTDNRA